MDCAQNVSTTYNLYGLTPTSGDALPYNQRTPLKYSMPANWTYGSLYRFYSDSSDSWYQENVCNISQTLQTNYTQGLLKRFSAEECINTYGRSDALLRGYGELLVVTKQQPSFSNATILMQLTNEVYISNYTGQNWICGPNYLIDNNYQCNYKNIAANASGWTLGFPHSDPNNDYRLARAEEWDIDYCLAQQTDLSGLCLLQYSLIIMIIILIANTIKFCCIFFLLWTHIEPVLATVGDGIASFINRPDRFTVNRPFLNRSQARKFKVLEKPKPVRWAEPKRALRWWNAPSATRWSLTLILYVHCLT